MPKKLVRVLAVGFVVLLLLVAGGYFGLQAYLSSGAARSLVSGKLSERFGGDVRITSLAHGAGSTTVGIEIRGLAEAGAPEDPLLAGTVKLDAGPIELARGTSPSTVAIEGATFTLHLDASGKVLTPFPKPKSSGGGGKLPDIKATGSTVRIVQAGRPEFKLAAVDVTVTDAGGTLKITAKAKDPGYGDWTATGDWAANGDTGLVSASTDGPVRLTPEKLKSIPFVPAETWETVELDGTSPVSVRIGREAGDKWTWHVEFAPTNTRVRVAPVGDFVVTDASGKVVVDMSKVTLSGFTGKAAGGSLGLESVMDFGPTPSKLEFTVDAKDMDVKQTPELWGLRQRLTTGRLNGKGAVTLAVADGKAKVTQARGEAVIAGKAFGGNAEVRVRPEVSGDGLKFSDIPDPKAGRDVTGPAALALIRAALPVLLQPPAAPPAAAKKDGPPQTVRANLRLTDVNLEELLAAAKVTSPVKLAGKVSLVVVADIPTAAPREIKLYKATGTVSASTLQIEGATLRDVTANAVLDAGVLTLSKLAANFPAEGGAKPPGFSGSAKLAIEPRGELAADLKLDRVPLGQVFAAIPGLAGKAAGELSGSFDLKADGNKLADLSGYVANGALTSDGLTLYGQKVDKLAINAALRDGVATLAKADASVYGGTVNAAGKVPLVGMAGGDFRVTFKNIDAGAATKAIPDPPFTLAGVVGGSFTGVLPPVTAFDASKVRGDLDLDAPRVTYNGVLTLVKLTGKVGYKPGAISYDLNANLASGGSVGANGDYPLTTPAPAPKDAAPAKPAGGTVRATGVRLDGLAREARVSALAPLRGVADLVFNYTFDADGRPTGTGRLAVTGLGWGASAGRSEVIAPIRLTADGVSVPDVTGSFAGGVLRGRVDYPFDATRRRFATVTLDNADLAAVLAPFGVKAEGRTSVTLRTRLGNEVRGSGTVAVSRAKFSTVDVSDLRVPLTWTYSAGAGAQVTAREATGTVAGGRVTGRADVTVRGTARVESRVEFVGLNVGAFSPAAGGYGLGKTTGRLDLNGSAVRGLNDLSGTLAATIGDASARELPLIGAGTNLLSPGASLTRFETGDVVARLGAGVVRVERLALAGRGARLFADGTVGASTGRLDLDVVYNTGQVGTAAPGLRAIARNIPAIGPIPVGLIVRVSEALSNRVVRLKIGGTVADPIYSLNAARLLTENAVRFFVGQYVPGADAITNR